MINSDHAKGVRFLRGLTFLFFSSWLITGCALNPSINLMSLVDDNDTSIIASVPFYAQSEYQCGPAALAGVLGYSGIKTSPQELVPQVYLPGRLGSLQIEILAATRRAGQIPYLLQNDPESLVAQVRSGRPVLVFQNLRTKYFPVWHYAVLIGIDPQQNVVYLNSGKHQKLAQRAPVFFRTWNWANNWAMVVLRPGEVPAQADAQRYIEAVASFELMSGTSSALPAWRAANKQWPKDARPYLALGNHAYGQGEKLTAIEFYNQGLAFDIASPALVNNLATVFGELGCSRLGEQLLRPMVAESNQHMEWLKQFEATLNELSSQTNSDRDFCNQF